VDISSVAQQAAMSGNMSSTAAREVSVMLSANTGPYQQEMKKAASATEQLADALHKVDLALKGTLKFAGTAMMGVGASMQAGATGAMWVAAQFEESFARVAKTTNLTNTFMGRQGKVADMAALFGLGDNELQRFENEIRALSTQIPVSVQELSYLADVAGTLGVESKNLGLFADTAAKLGAAINNLPSDQAIAGLANMIGAFGLAETQVVNLGSSLADLANHTRGEANEMLMFSDRMAGTAVQVGMAAEEVLGLGAAISAIGAQPQLGASAIVLTMTELSKAIQGGGEELRKFATVLGMTEDQLASMWSSEGGSTAVLMNLLRTLNLQGEEAVLTLDKLGLSGRGVSQVIGGLAAQYHVVAEAMGISNEAFEKGTAVQELAEVRFDTVIKASQQFGQTMTEVARSLGQPMLGGMKMLFESLTGLVNIFNMLPQPIKTVLGLITSLGGTALIAGGAFTIFFAKFHLFFMTLHMLPVLLRQLNTFLLALGGKETAQASLHLERLIRHFSRLSELLTDLPGLPGRLFTTLGAHLTTLRKRLQELLAMAMLAGRAGWGAFTGMLANTLPTAMAVAGNAATVLMAKLRALLGWFGRFFIIEHMTHALRGMGMAANWLATKAMAPLLLVAAKILIPLAALAFAITAGRTAIDRWRQTGGEATGMLSSLAEAAGMAFKEVENLNAALNSPSAREVNLAVEAKELLDTFRNLEQEDAQRLAVRYGLHLMQGGQSPDEVREHIEKLGRLSGKKLVFEYAMEGTLDIRQGQGLRDYLDSVGESIGLAISQYQQQDDSWLRQAWHTGVRGQPTPLAQAQLDDAVNYMQGAMSEANVATRIATMYQAHADLQKAIQSGSADLRAANTVSEQLIGSGILPEAPPKEFGWLTKDPEQWLPRPNTEGLNNWADRFIRKPLVDAVRATWASFSPDDFHSERFDDIFGLTGPMGQFQDQLAGLFSTGQIYDMEGGREIVRVTQEITGEISNLDVAIRNLDTKGMNDLADAIRDVGIAITESELERLVSGIDYDTNLAHQLAMGQQMYEDQDLNRFYNHFFETYPSQVGHLRALEEAQHELDKLVESGKAYTEEWERLHNFIKSTSDEWAQITINDLERQLNAMPAVEQVRMLNQELAALDMNQPYNAEVEVTIRERRAQALVQADRDFRQVMGEYDRLMDQREEAVRSHGERLEQMEENHQRNLEKMRENHDRNTAKTNEQHTKQLERMEEQRGKAVENARKQYQKRLEDIDKQEKKALEDRVEAMASAFNIMQRIQATPTAEIGALQNNMTAQNRAMREMTENINQLRQMGLSDDVMREMGLTDPKNFAQARRLLESALSDPSMISNINALWSERMNLAEAFVDQGARDEIKERFDEAREDAKTALDEQIKDINERYHEQVAEANRNLQERLAEAREAFDRQLADANESYDRSVEDANKAHQKQLEAIAEALAKLGKDSIETIDELIERALESGLDGLEERANLLRELMDEVAELDRQLERQRKQVYDPTDPASIDREFGITYDWEAEGTRGVETFTRGIFKAIPRIFPTVEKALTEGIDGFMTEGNRWIDKGVDGSFTILNRLTYQDGVWKPAEDAAKTGGKRVGDGVADGLRQATTGIDREMGNWAKIIEDKINPALVAIGEDPISITTSGVATRSGGGSPRPSVAFAEGGMLPDDARIQPPGTLVQWAEPETGGEAFIPLAPSKRQRSLAIWEKTGELLGASFANGGFLDRPDLSDYGVLGNTIEKTADFTIEKIADWMGSFGMTTATGALGPRSGQYGGVLPWVAWSGNVVNALFGPMPGGIGGVGPRSNPSDHPLGLALDFMTGDNARGHALGDRLVGFLMSNWVDHAVKYIIWKQRISHGGGWTQMAGRGSRTADHWDHPHVSYNASPPPNWDGPMGEIPRNVQAPRQATQTNAVRDEGPTPSAARTTSGQQQPGTMIAMADGGIDNIPAWLADGEFVMNPRSVDHYGVDFMEMVNAQRFSQGGLVGRSRGREPMGSQLDLVGALTKALESASFGQSETNHWDVKVEARDINDMISQLDRRKRLSRLTGAANREG
jgi:TP901 family phage tail tape measure protein